VNENVNYYIMGLEGYLRADGYLWADGTAGADGYTGDATAETMSSKRGHRKKGGTVTLILELKSLSPPFFLRFGDPI
jgi:hypothetical protein